ncbi:MAG: hypothetical protein P4L90_15610 [Rhodopila sp.]|nr:hypothetical protein [Rhodopila sp.]
MRTASVAIICWLSLYGAAAAACAPPAPVRFAPGADATDLHGGVARGERACFSIGARKGQTLSITQPDTPHPNIAIQLYRPPWHITDEDGVASVTGTPLKGAEEGTDATQWRGALPASGNYLLVVGTIRGGDEYRLHVEIR